MAAIGIPFYKNTANEWVIGSFTVQPSQVVKRVGQDSKVEFIIENVGRITGFYDDFEDANGADYTSLEALNEAAAGIYSSSSYPSGKPIRLSATVTRPADTNNYAAGDAINNATVAVKKKVTVTLSGTGGTANVTVGGVTKLATYVDSPTQTATNFQTAWVADYLTAGIVLTSSGADLIFEASVSGVDFATGSTANVTPNLAGAHVVTTANVTLGYLTFSPDAALTAGGGGVIISAMINTDIVQLAGLTVRIYLFKDIPSNVPADNAVYISNASNNGKRIPYIDVTFPALEVGATVLIGQESPVIGAYDCTAKVIYGLLMLPTAAVTAPKSGGYLNVYLFVNAQS